MPSFSSLLSAQGQTKKVLVAGDWHGNLAWSLSRIDEAARLRCKLILHLGDFGFLLSPKAEKFLEALNAKCARAQVHILVTPGNHENWDWLTTLWGSQPRPAAIMSHIWALPRGYRFSLSQVSFLSFGGAASVDYDRRTLGKNWWPKELPSLDDVSAASAQGFADVMLTHETPDLPYAVPLTEAIIRTNPKKFRAEGLAYSSISRERLTQVMLAVRPRLLMHGHIHVQDAHSFTLPKASHPTQVISLPEERQQGNTYLLDLEAFKKHLL